MSDLMKKHEMTEEDIKLQFITPAIEGAGWDRQKQIRMEYNFTDEFYNPRDLWQVSKTWQRIIKSKNAQPLLCVSKISRYSRLI